MSKAIPRTKQAFRSALEPGWNEHELQILRDTYQALSGANGYAAKVQNELAKFGYRKSICAIHGQKSRLGLPGRKQFSWTDSEVGILRELSSQAMGTNRWGLLHMIRDKLKQAGYPERSLPSIQLARRRYGLVKWPSDTKEGMVRAQAAATQVAKDIAEEYPSELIFYQALRCMHTLRDQNVMVSQAYCKSLLEKLQPEKVGDQTRKPWTDREIKLATSILDGAANKGDTQAIIRRFLNELGTTEIRTRAEVHKLFRRLWPANARKAYKPWDQSELDELEIVIKNNPKAAGWRIANIVAEQSLKKRGINKTRSVKAYHRKFQKLETGHTKRDKAERQNVEEG
ncbi:hypothetical protein PMZ80_008880 [Knufia obscura]|uniref:Uncharacterized protein n=1 Tax=Knufia obscura TaxID=1635080 RepID=A0ABR0REM4_9EURO|nr:hypothetical protein PMZ80_008880 [Knufia obscura]